VEALELRVPADECSREPSDPARAHQRKRAEHPAATNSRRLPFRLDRARVAELEGASRRGDGALTRQDLAGLRRLFEARGDIDGVAADERAPRARDPGDHLAGVHPDTERETFLELALHRQRGV